MNKALASLAIIKVNWDEQKKDYIQNFVPFIVTLIRRKRYSTIDVNIVRKDFEDEFGLVIPYHPMITLLERARRQGYIQKKQPGKYIPIIDKIAEYDFSEVALEQERKYSNVVKKFIDFCKLKGEDITEEQVDAIIISFFKEHDLDILFASLDNNLTILPGIKIDQANNTYIQSYLINSFVKTAHESDPETFGFIVDLSVGHLMANTLLYSQDYQKFRGRFIGNYYLDTGLLFNIIGINGQERKLAYEEFVKLLIDNGAQVFVFRHTYEEFVGIVENCMYWIESPDIDPAKANQALMFFIDNGFSCSDIEQFILKISDTLENLHITIVSVPDPNQDIAYQIDEVMLKEMIINTYKENIPNFDEEEKDYTIQQDIKSLAAIFKLRRGEKPLKISDSKHLFVTTNATLAFVSRKYEIMFLGESNFFFIPISLTDVFIGTLVWVNSPAKVLAISQKRLIANCYAALQPSNKLLKKYIGEIERLEEQGEIEEDEATILKVSRVARNLLLDETMGDPDRFTDKTATEILAEMRENIKKEEIDKLNAEKLLIQGEREKLKEKELALEAEKRLSDERFSVELLKKERKVAILTQERDRLEKNIGCIAKTLAWIIAGLFYAVSIGMVILAAVIQLWPRLVPMEKPWTTIITLMAVVLGIISLITGANFNGARDSLKKFIESGVLLLFKK